MQLRDACACLRRHAQMNGHRASLILGAAATRRMRPHRAGFAGWCGQHAPGDAVDVVERITTPSP
ncbi:MAG: hypothetical protein U0694_15740 [Anaerolineae bacterium]